VLLWVAPAVAEAAIESGVARVESWEGREAYARRLESLLGPAQRVMGALMEKAKRTPARIVFPDGDRLRVMRAAQRMVDEGLGEPLLIGHEGEIREIAREHEISLEGAQVVDPRVHPERERLAERLYEIRQRKGVAPRDAARIVLDPTYFGMMLVETGQADGLVGGVGYRYSRTVKPALEIIGPRPDADIVCSVLAAIHEDRLYLLTDPAINIDPDAHALAEIAIFGAEVASEIFDLEPKVALVSHSNFGSVNHPSARKVAQAAEMVRRARPDLAVDGEMHADTALNPEVAKIFPHSRIQGDANVLVFPDLAAGNIAYKLLVEVAGIETVGPILWGLNRPVNVLAHVATVEEIIRAAAITSLQARPRAGRGGELIPH
jgi:malate dehydrogenase (oxaloacetate-decarboxylating)(NADP+)